MDCEASLRLPRLLTMRMGPDYCGDDLLIPTRLSRRDCGARNEFSMRY